MPSKRTLGARAVQAQFEWRRAWSEANRLRTRLRAREQEVARLRQPPGAINHVHIVEAIKNGRITNAARTALLDALDAVPRSIHQAASDWSALAREESRAEKAESERDRLRRLLALVRDSGHRQCASKHCVAADRHCRCGIADCRWLAVNDVLDTLDGSLVAEMTGSREGGPDSVEWLREQRDGGTRS